MTPINNLHWHYIYRDKTMTQPNPLSKHFRQPAIFIKLPSQGQYWPKDSIELPVTGDLPVYPMTTKDEILLRTPDALINGTGVVQVIQSCIPNITDPWQMPSIDVDACLIAIRIASYGNKMDLDTTCPNCKTEESRSIELSNVLDSINMPDYDKPVMHKGLTIKLQPQSYFGVNKANTLRFKEQKLLEVLADTDITAEEREVNLKHLTEEMIQLNNDTLTNCTEFITTPDGITVTEKQFIKEFYNNAESVLIRKLQQTLGTFSTAASIKPFGIDCNNCQHHFDAQIEFDYANFFAQGS